MTLRVALQMDPVESINIDTDSSFMLGMEATRRGYTLFYYTPDTLAMEAGNVTALVYPLKLRREKGNHFTLGEGKRQSLETLDVILLRQDPPFDMRYITTTFMLERLAHPLVVNNPTEVRNSPEKLLVTHFSDLMSPTLITEDREAILEFYRTHRDIILKPLYGNGGSDIIHLKEEDKNTNSTLEMLKRLHPYPLVVQRYIPEIRQGDKRILLVNGKPVGAVNRVPSNNETRANLHVGGKAEKTTLTKRDLEICDRIGGMLKEKGLLFVGIDVIGNYITEINVTSPTGIQEINWLDQVAIESLVWDEIEASL